MLSVWQSTTRTEDHLHWVTWESIKEEAEKLKSERVGEEPILSVDENGKAISDPFNVSVLRKHIDELVAKKPIGELLIGPGMPLSEARDFKFYARSQNIKFDVRQYQGEQYWLLYENFSYPDLVEVLKERKSYGKYELVDRSELPTYASIEKIITRPATEDDT